MTIAPDVYVLYLVLTASFNPYNFIAMYVAIALVYLAALVYLGESHRYPKWFVYLITSPFLLLILAEYYRYFIAADRIDTYVPLISVVAITLITSTAAFYGTGMSRSWFAWLPFRDTDSKTLQTVVSYHALSWIFLVYAASLYGQNLFSMFTEQPYVLLVFFASIHAYLTLVLLWRDQFVAKRYKQFLNVALLAPGALVFVAAGLVSGDYGDGIVVLLLVTVVMFTISASVSWRDIGKVFIDHDRWRQ